MQPPTTIEEIERRDNKRENIGIIGDVMNQLGDIPVIHSRDEEGNSYNTIKSDSISYMDTDKAGRVLVLYPFEEYIDEQLFNND